MAPAAYKGVFNTVFGRLVSRHPYGLLQSAQYVEDCSFGEFKVTYQGIAGTSSLFNIADETFKRNGQVVINCDMPEFYSTVLAASSTTYVTDNHFILNVKIPQNVPDPLTTIVSLGNGANNIIDINYYPLVSPTATSRIAYSELSGAQNNTVNLKCQGPNIGNRAMRIVAGPTTKVNVVALSEPATTILNSENTNQLHVPFSRTVKLNKSGIAGPTTEFFTFSLPGNGVYLVSCNLTNSSFGHSRAVTFLVTISAATALNISQVTPLGTPLVKGTLFTSLELSVNNTTFTATATCGVGITAGLNFSLVYGFIKVGEIDR